ncbi:radical SAM family heme chaperone HemW [candidate division WOR-3 bacterium]|nr:radical SAM family heme chaperone HemW [candidate division WOR-3 bacterium]
MPGLYIHIPFCIKKCKYCAFHSLPYNSELVKQYIVSLKKEAELRKETFGKTYDTVYIGGGTPSVLKISELLDILKIINYNFNLSPREFTIEVNPGTVSSEKLTCYRNAGINRLSFGIQSLNDKELEYLGRIHTGKEAVECFKDARFVGFKNISIDLIYGIPIQERNSWHSTLNGITALYPEHISAYSLSYEPDTPLYGEKPMKEDLEEKLYYYMIEYLKDKGYEQYEISSFATSGYKSRHNLNYWNGGIYLGLGPSAHSFDGTHRYANPELFDYIKGKSFKKEKINRTKALEEYIMLGLRKRDGISLSEFSHRFAKGIHRKLIKVIKQTDLEFNEDRVRIPEKKQFVADAIILSIISRLCNGV